MGGLIKWLKKDGTARMRRRESAPLQFFNKRRPSGEEAYRESLIRFTKFRENERLQRLSMGANELAAYQSISNDPASVSVESTTPTEQRTIQYCPNTCPSKSSRSQSVSGGRHDVSLHNGHRTKKISVQFHLSESTEESDVNYDNHRASRHSMPVMTSNGHSREMRRGQTSIDSQTIREEEIEEFEGAHCTYGNSVNDDDQSSYRSPPTKFYKQNLNPFPSTSETSSLSTLCEAQAIRGNCPAKPKRLLLNSKQSRKLLTEAHFTGAYRNFEIQSPYYSDSSSVVSGVGKSNHRSFDADSLNDDKSTPPYQIIVNKHGDEVEYALPCIDMPEYQRRHKLPNCLTSDDSLLAGEVFNENLQDFDRILNENFEMSSKSSVSMHEEIQTSHRSYRDHRHNNHVMITDLDKSTDSTNTIHDLDTTNRDDLQTNRISYFHQTMQHATDVVCMISDFNSAGKMEAKIETPLHFEWGEFKTTNVTVRKYTDQPIGETNSDFTLIAETAIIRDAEILRKIRHPTVINLMAIAFEPYRRLALIMEPTKSSLNHLLFVKNEQLDIKDVVVVVKKVADAVQYLHEFDICHSNISSHAILVGNHVTNVKLTSFELAVSYKLDIHNENELKSMEKTKRVPSIRQKRSPKQSLNSEQKIERYKLLSTADSLNRNLADPIYSVPFIREINAKYFPYSTEYRRKLSIFNYQAPELLSQTESFVYPTKHSDTYALTLLLWELLNQCIPFIIYDEVKLYELLRTNYPLKFLPIVEEERCQRFHDILERGLKREPDTRIDLDKMIRKLATIETEISRETEKTPNVVNCCCLKKQNAKNTQRRSIQENPVDDAVEKMTPDKSTSKLFTIMTSPKPSPVTALSANSTEKNISPLNNVTNNTFYRSILDFNKLLSPRRDTNDDTYQRSSTLKKRKKMTQVNGSKRNVKDLFGDRAPADGPSDELKTTIVNGRDSCSISSGRPSNEFNNALTKSAIYKELDYTNMEDKSETEATEKPVVKKIEQPFGPKEDNDHVKPSDLKSSMANNSSYQFVIDDYELPQELIARNNKIRRCTWLSSDQVNSSMQYDQTVNSGLQGKCAEIGSLPTLNESSDSDKKMNVSIKIVHTKMTPTKNVTSNESGKSISHNESMKSDCSTVSAASSEDDFSVKSRIKFFRSLESQPVQKRTPNKSKVNMSRRSEMSFNEAKKAIEKAQRHTYPSSNQPENVNQQLIKEITEITADIKNCLSKNKYLKETKDDDSKEANEKQINYLLKSDFNEADESVALLLDDLLNQKNLLDENSKNESCNESAEKRNSVRETVQKFESSLRNEKNDKSFSIHKIENKLLNEKIFNTDMKSDANKRSPVFFGKDNNHDEVTDEKVEEVIRFEAPSEAENEAGSQLPLDLEEPITETDNQQSQTLIKRTFYQESIISGTNVDMPELKSLLANSPTVSTAYATTRKSSLTTRVTLNMRKCRRRSSDVGLIGQQNPTTDFQNEVINSPHMNEVRHSICGSPLPLLTRNNSVEATSSHMMDQISGEKFKRSASGLIVSNDQLQTSVSSVLTGIFNGKQIQSIEDLYIDDDFGGCGLAANMKLMTNSTDSLDNINFDLISTHIFEQTSESMMTTNTTNANGHLNAIEQGENEATDEQSK